jgi:hypothetical protein
LYLNYNKFLILKTKNMKKILLVLMVAAGITASAQSTTSNYVAVGVSMTNAKGDTFSNTSYPSLEVGMTKAYGTHSVSYGVAAGFNSFSDGHTWVEAKVTPSVPLGPFNGNVIFGVGTFFEKNTSFVEYGFGMSKTCKGGFTTGLSYSNWAGTNYVTPSVSYSF